ncbi:hypothetical protein [Flavobacterium salmonis]|uniref:Uncharacterized protein n=1 Tax=Flavobacterium salmonis TaxID=2654844 RepID=A0A6V6Z4N0_9FLAO|nr:hypothetical protein [Flavobacterium salmonis]CAD0006394.1 hypothetical protein FLAT13_03304 [Flavobacterium salmonis]
MEIQNKERAAQLLELIDKKKYFKKLKSDNKIGNSFDVTLKVSGYNQLNLMVSDLLKASILLLHHDSPSLPIHTVNTDINVMTLLEIALQLLPEDEMELLDELHKLQL